MAGNGKVLINLATGVEDGERVLVAFLVASAAQQQGKLVPGFGRPRTRCGSGCPASCRESSARTARRSSDSGTSSQKAAESSGCVLSA